MHFPPYFVLLIQVFILTLSFINFPVGFLFIFLIPVLLLFHFSLLLAVKFDRPVVISTLPH